MTGSERRAPIRRQPPELRVVPVSRLEQLSPYLVAVTLAGPGLEGFEAPEPAASVRVLFPPAGNADLVLPDWNGNEFLLPDGERPLIRTFTPRRFDALDLELEIHIVLHEGGAASSWVEAAKPGDPVAVAGPGRGYRIDPTAASFFLAGDETALPAIGQLLEAIDPSVPVRAIIEIRHPDARLDLPPHPQAHVEWVELPAGSLPGNELIETITRATIQPGTKVWVAGEAGSLVPIRKYLFDEIGLGRSDATVRGYWKHGR